MLKKVYRSSFNFVSKYTLMKRVKQRLTTIIFIQIVQQILQLVRTFTKHYLDIIQVIMQFQLIALHIYYCSSQIKIA